MEIVIVLHGIIKYCTQMTGLAKHLDSAGFKSICIDYPSTKHSIPELVDIVKNLIDTELKKHKYSKVHFVGYSLGGVLTRMILAKYNFAKLGRVVLHAPPNNGSEVATFFKNFYPYKKLFGPAGQELELGLPKVKHLFNDPKNIEFGVIAGNSTVNPFFSYFLIREPGDGKVSVKSTKFSAMKEHIILPVSHVFFPYNKEVYKQTVLFLQNGHFKIE